MDSNTLNKWLFTPRYSVAMSDSDHTSPSPAQRHPDSTPNAPLSDPNRAAENAATEELKLLILRGSGSIEVETGSSTGEWESQKIGVPRKQAEEEEEGNRGGEEEEEELQNVNEKGTQYSVRPDAEDSAYYMMWGICKFGSNCKFNHPVGRKAQIARDKANDREAAMENPGQVECKYYLSQGGCKFGQSCKFSHSRTNLVAPALSSTFWGCQSGWERKNAYTSCILEPASMLVIAGSVILILQQEEAEDIEAEDITLLPWNTIVALD